MDNSNAGGKSPNVTVTNNPSFLNRSVSNQSKSGFLGKIKKFNKKGIDIIKKDYANKKKLMSGVAHGTEDIANKITNSDDPMSELGIGISSYHNLLVMLFSLFFVLILIHYPVVRSFSSHAYFDEEKAGSFLLRRTLGNLGYSKSRCIQASLIKGNKKELECHDGLITELVDWGITIESEGHMVCKTPEINFCSQFLDKNRV